MGIFSFFTKNSNQGIASNVLYDETYLHSNEFRSRWIRARNDNLQIIEFKDELKSSARIYNHDTNEEYTVSLSGCECEDFNKNKHLCKHMMFLMLKTNRYRELEIKKIKYVPSKENDRFIPLYWEYYKGEPTGLGYMNLYPYEVTGRKQGVSKKTGKPTNRKTKIRVYAHSNEDALIAAEEKGVIKPYENCELIDCAPSYEQYHYLDGVGIPHPNLLTSVDLSALLTRYEDYDNDKPSTSLFALATKYRVSVSYFCSTGWIISNIWGALSDSQKIPFYCYAIFCQEKHFNIGEASIGPDASVFKSFTVQDNEKEYILSIYEFGYHPISKNSQAYHRAIDYLKSYKMI